MLYDGNRLLKIARVSLEDSFAGLDRPPEDALIRRGSFVTLKKHGNLRGCIGYMSAVADLYKQTYMLAREAAFSDWRFEPLRSEELPLVDIEVSVLSPLEHIESIDEIEIGRHGVLMSLGGYRAVFLPEVAPEQGWDRDEMLRHLALKAGLPENAYLNKDAHFEVFSSEVFHEV